MSPKHRPATIGRNLEIRKMYESGMSLREIAPHFGIASTNVRKAILQAGGKTRPKGFPRPKPPRGLLGWLMESDR